MCRMHRSLLFGWIGCAFFFFFKYFPSSCVSAVSVPDAGTGGRCLCARSPSDLPGAHERSAQTARRARRLAALAPPLSREGPHRAVPGCAGTGERHRPAYTSAVGRIHPLTSECCCHGIVPAVPHLPFDLQDDFELIRQTSVPTS